MSSRNVYRVIATMSGSSLDGLDIVYAHIQLEPQPTFRIIAADTFAYTDAELQVLRVVSRTSMHTDDQTDRWYGAISAAYIRRFIQQLGNPSVDLVASHGHTTLHKPALGISQQIGDPQVMADALRLPVIARFRQADVDAGGQGAPLVPLCDQLFFAEYDACLNIGGIANISFETPDGRVGFDICGANQILNFFAEQAGWPYDAEGEMAAAGEKDAALFDQLNAIPFLSASYPKSLDNHFVHRAFIEPLQRAPLMLNDKLATAAHHIAYQIARVIEQQPGRRALADYRLLVTGGGAFNRHLIKLIEEHAGIRIQLPDKIIIQYKEALAMALMGVLRHENRPNFLPSVTGARIAVSGGVIATPGK